MQQDHLFLGGSETAGDPSKDLRLLAFSWWFFLVLPGFCWSLSVPSPLVFHRSKVSLRSGRIPWSPLRSSGSWNHQHHQQQVSFSSFVCWSSPTQQEDQGGERKDMNAWGGSYAKEATVAADLVCKAVRLCWEVQESLAIAKGETTLGTTVDPQAQTSGAAEIKVDGTPVTAADFGIQGYVSSKLAQIFQNDRFMGEEDATDLRKDPALLQNALDMANQMYLEEEEERINNTLLSKEDFLWAVDRGTEPPREKEERVWILDPIDGTKGLITGKQYIVGLALTIRGKAVVAVMGNPGASPEVMVAVQGHGLRYWDAGSGEGPLPPPTQNQIAWHQNRFDFGRLVPEGAPSSDFGWGSGSSSARFLPGVDYPPFLLSRPMTVGSPLPFGPLCAPSEICCGAQVKYFAVAKGDVAGFIQFQESSLKSWDHAPGVLCVEESGGRVMDANEKEICFDGREFSVSKGIVCCAHAADTPTRQRLLACVQQTNITSFSK